MINLLLKLEEHQGLIIENKNVDVLFTHCVLLLRVVDKQKWEGQNTFCWSKESVGRKSENNGPVHIFRVSK